MGINSTEVSYGFGQLGSVYTDAPGDAIKPPTNKVFVAITMLADTVFDSGAGLVADNPTVRTDVNTTAVAGVYIGTEKAAGDLANDAETTDEGSGGKVVDSVVFPKGVTIYGRWTEIDVSSGSVVAYIGA